MKLGEIEIKFKDESTDNWYYDINNRLTDLEKSVNDLINIIQRLMMKL